MEIIQVFGFLSAFFIGLILGILGNVDSILTVPVFVYIFSLNPVTALAYSLFVVGIIGAGGVFFDYTCLGFFGKAFNENSSGDITFYNCH